MKKGQQISTEVLSKLHDAELSDVSINRNKKTLMLSFVTENSEEVRILFDGVVFQRINNVINQNVISYAVLSGVSNISVDNLNSMSKWVTSIGKNDTSINEDSLSNHIRKILNNDTILFYVEPSWGAEIGVISNEVTLFNY
jgi:hypothetical protein